MVSTSDSHTASHGALGALGFGIGTSEVEHVLATQTLLLKRSKSLEVRVDGELGPGVTPADVALAIIANLLVRAMRGTSPNIPDACSATCRSRI